MSTEPCIPGIATSRTSFGWSKAGNVTSAGWQVTLRDPITACEFQYWTVGNGENGLHCQRAMPRFFVFEDLEVAVLNCY